MTQNNKVVIELRVPAIAKYGSLVRDLAFGVTLREGFSLEDGEDVRLSVGEAFTNAIQYAYGGETLEKNVEVICQHSAEGLELSIRDFGCGFTEENHPPSNSVGLGMGITFMKSLMDEVKINSMIGYGTEVLLVKKHESPNAPAELSQ
jgi:serine/threonine-protein kinase RsbW